MTIIARTYFFVGKVQGVGFRFTTQILARSFPINGFVRNLSNGQVEVYAEGYEEDLAAFVQAIMKEFGSSIQRVDIQEVPVMHVKGFEIMR